MIEAPSFSSGKAFCTVNNVPFILNSLSNSSSVMLPKGSKFEETGVSKNDIDSSLRLDGLVETTKVGQFGQHLPDNAGNIAADCPHGLIEFLLTTARDEDVSTFSDEEASAAANPIPVVPLVLTFLYPVVADSFNVTIGSSTNATPLKRQEIFGPKIGSLTDTGAMDRKLQPGRCL